MVWKSLLGMRGRRGGKQSPASGGAGHADAGEQHAALAMLMSLTRTGDERDAQGKARPARSRGVQQTMSRPAGRPHKARPVPGALNDTYDIPVVTFSHRRARGLTLTVLLICAVIGWRVFNSFDRPISIPLLALAVPVFAFKSASWIVSWRDEPVSLRRWERDYLAGLCVVVTVPVYNEDPALLDRCLFALMNQTRPPQRVDVVDDGSKLDYSALQRYWEGTWPGGIEVRWLRQHNQGKRRAHSLTFASAPEADIFITVDSDTTLESRGIEEGLKPFANRKVMSVAGIEMGFNANTNFLTRMQSCLQLFSQVVMGATWSVVGDMYTNRGPFALYRATMVREIVPLYRDEQFFGHRVVLGDDSLLALCASGRGRSVQQLSAFGLTMWPETLGHHARQRIRWARGRAVRNFWRLKYRPLSSFIWWFTAIGIYTFLASAGLILLIPATWPQSAHTVADMLLAMFTWHSLNQLRTLCFRRSDETWADAVVMMLIRPLSSLWASVVLAVFVRAYGTATLLRQGWTTRQHGAELVLAPAEDEAVA